MADMPPFREALSDAFHAAFPQDDRRLVFGEGPASQPRLMLIG